MARVRQRRGADKLEKVPGVKRRQSRTSNACESCKKRKTKCNGRPSPCNACEAINAYCHFSPKLDLRRKGSYQPSSIHEHRQFYLLALFQTLRHTGHADIRHLVNMIRNSDPLPDLAACLRGNFLELQTRGVLPDFEFDESDLLSIGLRSLFATGGELRLQKADGNTTGEEWGSNSVSKRLPPADSESGSRSVSLHTADASSFVSENSPQIFVPSMGFSDRSEVSQNSLDLEQMDLIATLSTRAIQPSFPFSSPDTLTPSVSVPTAARAGVTSSSSPGEDSSTQVANGHEWLYPGFVAMSHGYLSLQ